MSLTSEQINRVVRLTFDKKLVPSRPSLKLQIPPLPKGKQQAAPAVKPASLPGPNLGVPGAK